MKEEALLNLIGNIGRLVYGSNIIVKGSYPITLYKAIDGLVTLSKTINNASEDFEFQVNIDVDNKLYEQMLTDIISLMGQESYDKYNETAKNKANS